MSGERLASARLRLRPVEMGDIPTLFEWYRDPHLMTLYDAIPFDTTMLEAFEIEYRFWLESDVQFGFAGAFLMELVDTSTPIGECSWMLVDRTGPASPGVYQVGGLIGPAELRGKGYGTEALRLLRDYLFGHEHAHRLEALTGAFNTGAMKTLHKNGFAREGVLREAVLIDDKWQDRVLFGLLRKEWEAKNGTHAE